MTILKIFKEFLELNKDKLTPTLKWTSVIFTSLVLVVFGWGYLVGQTPDWKLFLGTLLVAGLFFPFFCMALGTIKEFQTYKRTKTIFDIKPFNELTKNNLFQISDLSKKSKWLLTQFALTGQFRDYSLMAQAMNSTVNFEVFVHNENVKNEHIKKLRQQFPNNRFMYERFGIVMIYDKKSKVNLTYERLMHELDNFVQFFEKENIRPL